MRFLAVALGVLLFGSTAHAQAFKPRGGAKTTPAKTDKKPGKTKAAKAAPATDSEAGEDSEDSEDKPAKKKSAAKTAATKSRGGAKKTSRAAKDGRPDDLTPGPAGKHDPDFVLITDDDEIE